MSFVERIFEFNQAAGLLDKPYDDFLESSFQIEEALEGFIIPSHGWTLDETEPKALSRQIVTFAQMEDSTPLSDVDRLDKACDAIVFAVGSIGKLRLSREQAHRALNIVMDANQAKLGCPKDEHGKLTKPADFPNPEPRLQALLDERN